MERPRFWLVFMFNSRRLYPIAWCRPCGRPRDMEHIAGAALAAGLIPPDDDIRWSSSGSTCRNRAASSHQRNRRVETEQRAAICRICAICVRKRFLCSHYFSFWADICSFFTSLASGRVRTRQSRAPPTMTADDDQRMLPICCPGIVALAVHGDSGADGLHHTKRDHHIDIAGQYFSSFLIRCKVTAAKLQRHLSRITMALLSNYNRMTATAGGA